MGSQDRAGGVSGDWEAGSQQMMKSLSLLALVAGAVAQKPARIGADGKPLLDRPDIEECMKRKSHMKIGNHNYFLSWREPWHSLRTGIGSTGVISAETAAWTLCPLTHLASSRCSKRSWQETMSPRSTPLVGNATSRTRAATVPICSRST